MTFFLFIVLIMPSVEGSAPPPPVVADIQMPNAEACLDEAKRS